MDLRFDQVDNRLDAISSALEANNKARRACQFNANLPANAGVNFQPVPLTSLTPGNMPNGLMQRFRGAQALHARIGQNWAARIGNIPQYFGREDNKVFPRTREQLRNWGFAACARFIAWYGNDAVGITDNDTLADMVDKILQFITIG
eukprot:Opistho-2@56860